jgi:hypothetical protein
VFGGERSGLSSEQKEQRWMLARRSPSSPLLCLRSTADVDQASLLLLIDNARPVPLHQLVGIVEEQQASHHAGSSPVRLRRSSLFTKRFLLILVLACWLSKNL